MRAISFSTSDIDAVQETNLAFYGAFEARDMDAMSSVWEHSDRVVCTHPGWAMLRGWGAVSASWWFAIFQNPQRLQFILTNDAVEVVGDMAWVTNDENLIDGGPGSTIAAVNAFVRGPDGWRLVLHHGGGVMHRPDL